MFDRAVDFSFAHAPQFGNAILQKLAAMRAADPIYRSEANGGIWVVTGHRQVTEGFAGKKPLSSVRLPDLVLGQIPPDQQLSTAPYLIASTPHWVVNMDRPGQTRLRNLAQKAFSAAIAEATRPQVRRFIDEAFDTVVGQDDYDFVDRVARRIPGRTILHLIGLPPSLYPRLHYWSITLSASLAGFNPSPSIVAQSEAVLLEMRALFLPELEMRRASPRDDFMTALVQAKERDGDRLSDEEMLALLYLTLIAGHDTTANTIALGTAALAEHPDVCRYMRDHPEQIGGAVMEIMRFIAMSTMMARIASEDFDWDGHTIRKGEFVFLMIAGANRDPAVFADPDRFDPTRPQTGNMVFGPGLHFCIGNYLAKVQLHEYFTALVERFDPEWLDDRLHFGNALSFRGVETMRMRLRPHAG